jgi:hypothetical protein
VTVNRGKTPPTDPLSPRERRLMLIAAGVMVVLIAVGAVIWATVSHAPNDCVSISVAGPMGGAIEHACGGAAREWCQAASLQHDAHSEAVQAQCRAAGILR